MRPFHTMLLALALVVLCSDVATKVAVANGGGGGATLTPMDCKVLPSIPGVCKPKKCMEHCQGGLGKRTSVGQCVSDGCQCTYCTSPPRAVRN